MGNGASNHLGVGTTYELRFIFTFGGTLLISSMSSGVSTESAEKAKSTDLLWLCRQRARFIIAAPPFE